MFRSARRRRKDHGDHEDQEDQEDSGDATGVGSNDCLQMVQAADVRDAVSTATKSVSAGVHLCALSYPYAVSFACARAVSELNLN